MEAPFIIFKLIYIIILSADQIVKMRVLLTFLCFVPIVLTCFLEDVDYKVIVFNKSQIYTSQEYINIIPVPSVT